MSPYSSHKLAHNALTKRYRRILQFMLHSVHATLHCRQKLTPCHYLSLMSSSSQPSTLHKTTSHKNDANAIEACTLVSHCDLTLSSLHVPNSVRTLTRATSTGAHRLQSPCFDPLSSAVSTELCRLRLSAASSAALSVQPCSSPTGADSRAKGHRTC